MEGYKRNFFIKSVYTIPISTKNPFRGKILHQNSAMKLKF